jgi:hypothetical protein
LVCFPFSSGLPFCTGSNMKVAIYVRVPALLALHIISS